MNTETVRSTHTKVYRREDGRAVIEQGAGAVVVLSADQILAVIDELHACYDYCAAWKNLPQPDRSDNESDV